VPTRTLSLPNTNDTRLFFAGALALLALVVYLAVAFANTSVPVTVLAPSLASKVAPWTPYAAKFAAIPRGKARGYIVRATPLRSVHKTSYGALVDTLVTRRWDFLSACRFPLADKEAMNVTNQLGNWVLTVTAMVLFFRPIRDSQSGMWVFRRAILPRLRVTSDGMPFSQEIKLEAILRGFRFGETHIAYGARIGEVKLQKWRDGWLNLSFLFRKRFGLV